MHSLFPVSRLCQIAIPCCNYSSLCQIAIRYYNYRSLVTVYIIQLALFIIKVIPTVHFHAITERANLIGYILSMIPHCTLAFITESVSAALLSDFPQSGHPAA